MHTHQALEQKDRCLAIKHHGMSMNFYFRLKLCLLPTYPYCSYLITMFVACWRRNKDYLLTYLMMTVKAKFKKKLGTCFLFRRKDKISSSYIIIMTWDRSPIQHPFLLTYICMLISSTWVLFGIDFEILAFFYEFKSNSAGINFSYCHTMHFSTSVCDKQKDITLHFH